MTNRKDGWDNEKGIAQENFLRKQCNFQHKRKCSKMLSYKNSAPERQRRWSAFHSRRTLVAPARRSILFLMKMTLSANIFFSDFQLEGSTSEHVDHSKLTAPRINWEEGSRGRAAVALAVVSQSDRESVYNQLTTLPREAIASCRFQQYWDQRRC